MSEKKIEIVRQDKDFQEFFHCECHDIGHVFSLWYMEETQGDPQAMYLNVLLDNYYRWWERILIGTKFTVCNKSYKDIFSNTLIISYDMDRLIDILQKMLKETVEETDNILSPVEIDTEQYLLRFDHSVDKWDGPDNVIYGMSAFRLGIEFPKNLGFFHRLWRSIKFAWGWKSRYCNGDSVEIDEQQAKSLIQLARLHRDFSEEKLKEMESVTI